MDRMPRRTVVANQAWYQISVLIKRGLAVMAAPPMVDIQRRKANSNTAGAQNTVPGNQAKSTKKENPAPQVLPKKIGLSDHYGRKEANCVEDAPKAG